MKTRLFGLLATVVLLSLGSLILAGSARSADASPATSVDRADPTLIGPTSVGEAPSSSGTAAPMSSATLTASSGPATSYQFGHYWVDGASNSTTTSNCLYHYEEPLSREWISYEVPNNSYPAIGHRYYIKADWGVTGNTCGGGAYVDLEWFLPDGTNFAIDQQNPVICLGEDIGKNNWQQYPNDCPQNPRKGVQGGMALNPESTGAWPTATGKEWQVWVPVTSTKTLPNGDQGTLQHFQGYFGFYDGFGDPADARTVQPVVQQSTDPYIYYPSPSTQVTDSTQYPGKYLATMHGFLNAQGQAGNGWIEAGTDTSYGISGGNFTVASGQCTTSSPCTLTSNWDGLPAGYTIHWRYVYQVGNTKYYGGDQVFVTPDTQKPTVSLTAPSGGTTVAGTEKLTANASDNGQVTEVDFLVDGKVVGTSGASPYSFDWNTNSVTDGQHNLTARAYDAKGNSATSGSVTVTVDNTAPNTTITSGPSGSARSSSPTFEISSSETGSTFECSLDGSAYTSCTSPKNYTDLADGSHKFQVKATDPADNVDPTPATRSWNIDTVKPSGTVKINGGAAYTKSSSVNLSLSATDPTPSSGLASMRFKNDSSSWSSWEPYATSKSWTLRKANGLRTVYVQYKDRAGNIATTALDRIKLDTTKPTITGMSPKPGSNTMDTTPTIKATVEDNMTNLRKANIKLYLNGTLISASKFDYSAATDKLIYNSPKLSKGKKTVKIVARDAAGNVSAKGWYFTIK